MNNNIAVPDGNAWIVDRYQGDARSPQPNAKPEQGGLDFATLLRIVSNWRWLIIGAVGLGLIVEHRCQEHGRSRPGVTLWSRTQLGRMPKLALLQCRPSRPRHASDARSGIKKHASRV